ncbi:hypothetical protein Poli38472_008485 [Pythium oligandrum]|uniref:N-alpha-acetyltransferase 35, NatC auxiliary subunit n=1 Tax=Pythium oligandrum TaxID=41045 RepID=A0A8K1C3L3_PYTOL|nr:hypothetical protein Poli38472_008485 [Pythium oligandrum]|eukprot:TMW55837.1 hypothetical protein Poli38472_008485 [Pythium oligandrum]
MAPSADSAAAKAATTAMSQWQDVTELFGTAAKELKVGHLVHVESFNLFDSMSALELMDPKMDAGMALHGAAPLSIADRLQQKSIPLSFTSARDVLATMDLLFRHEAAWLNGQPLAQTLLTCVYMHRDVIRSLLEALVPRDGSEKSVEDRLETALQQLGGSVSDTLSLVMATFTLMILHTSSHVREVVVRADIYEEEDFSPGTGFDLSIFEWWTRPATEMLLIHTIDRLEKLLAEQRTAAASRGSSKKASKKKTGKAASGAQENNEKPVDSLQGLHTNVKISVSYCEAMLRRLRLRKVLYLVYNEMGLAETLCDLAHAREQFASAQELLKSFATEPLEFDPECLSGKPFGFDPALNRLISSSTPPREVALPTLDDALAIYQKLLEELVAVCSPGVWTTMEEVRVFLSDFSRKKPGIIARSFVLLYLYCDKKIYGKHGFMDWLTEEMVLNGVPSVLLSTQEGVQFSSRSIETVYESLKVYLFNRSRQRARIEYLLEEWGVLQLEASVIDERFTTEMSIPKATYPRYFTAWTLEQVVVLMLQYVSLGFELELYAPSEYSMVYWYLDYLYGSRLQNLNFTWGFIDKMKEIMKDHPRGRGKAGKEENQAGKDDTEETMDPTKARYLREMSYCEMQRSLMRAFFQAFAAMEREELVSATLPTYGTHAIRFQHRFAPFQSLQYPAPLVYEDYLKNSDFSRFAVDLIYKSVEECFKATRTHAEQALLSAISASTATEDETGDATTPVHGDEIKQALQVAIANAVRLARREQEQAAAQGKAGRKSRNHQVSTLNAPTTFSDAVEFSLHPYFPLLRLSRSGPSSERR